MISFGDYVPQTSQQQRNIEAQDQPNPLEGTQDRSVLGAAFQQDNFFAGVINMVNTPTFERETGFDWEARQSTSQAFDFSPESFLGVRSADEWNFMEQKVLQEVRNRQIVTEGGWAGIGASIAAGVISPTILLPGGVGAKALTVGSALKSGTAWGVAAISADEVLLHAAQETRTGRESAANIATGGIISGAFGGAIRYLDPLGMGRIVKAIEDPENSFTIQSSNPMTLSTDPAGVSANNVVAADMGDLRKILGKPHNTGRQKLIDAALDEGYSQIKVGDEVIDLTEELLARTYAGNNPTSVQGSNTIPAANSMTRAIQTPLETVDDSVGAARTPREDIENSDRRSTIGEAQDSGLLIGTRTRLGRMLSFSNSGALSSLWTGPATRQAMNSSPTMRWAANQLSTAGLMREGNTEGISTARGGDVESRVNAHNYSLAQTTENLRQIFKKEWVSSQGKSRLRAMFPGGDYTEFVQEVGRATFRRLHGEKHELDVINKAVDQNLSGLTGPIMREIYDLDIPGYTKVDYEENLLRAQQMIRRDLLASDMQGLKHVIRENAIKQLTQNADLINDKSFRDALGFDMSPSDVASARARGEVIDINTFADIITQRIMDGFTGFGSNKSLVSILQAIKTPKIQPFVYFDPFEKFSGGKALIDFLETDQEVIMRRFTRKAAADLELFRTFGHTNPIAGDGEGVRIWDDIDTEFNEAIANLDEIKDKKKREKASQELFASRAKFEEDFEVMVQRIKHEHGMPDNPEDFGFNMGRNILNLNTSRLMGTVAISSLPDIGRPVMKFGLLNTFREGLIPLLTDFKNFRVSANEGLYSGAALDYFNHARAAGMFDTYQDMGSGGKFSRGLEYLTGKIGRVALFDHWTTAMKQFSSAVGIGKLMHDLDAVVAGKASKAQTSFLASLNLGKDVQTQLHKLIRSHGGTEVRPGVFFPNTEKWGLTSGGKDYFDPETLNYRKLPPGEKSRIEDELELRRVFRAAVSRMVNDTVITPGIEKPTWTDSGTFGRLISQFRSFTFSSTLKTFVAARQSALVGDWGPVATGSAFSVAGGMMSYYLWGMTKGGKDQAQVNNELEAALNGDTQAMARFLDEGISRSGLLGVFEEGRKFAERVGLEDYTTLASTPTSRSPFVSPVTDALGPWLPLIGEFDNAATNPSGNTISSARNLMPYQNVFYLRQVFDKIEEAAADYAGVN